MKKQNERMSVTGMKNSRTVELEKIIKSRTAVLDSALDHYLPSENAPPQSLHKAMRYSVFAGGKRIRPMLTLLTAELFTREHETAIPPACAIEFIHTYSLIHDDLPAMDDDDYRRGKPTSHKMFGEGLAVLAGDALLTLAFEILSAPVFTEGPGRKYWERVPSERKLQLFFEIARAAGVKGMVGGQVMDLEAEGKKPRTDLLDTMNDLKTGALLTASMRSGALAAGCGPEELDKVTAFALLLGRAFQVVDDLLDVEGDAGKMGKAKGADAHKKKASYVSCCGLQETREIRDRLYVRAVRELESLGKGTGALRTLTDFIFYRDF